MPVDDNKRLEAITRAKTNGYVPDERSQDDSRRGQGKHVPKVVKRHDDALELYVTWLFGRHLEQSTVDPISQQRMKTSEEIRRSALGTGACLPSLELVKDFARFYIRQSNGAITKNGRATLDTTKTFFEFFFAGFTRVTGTETTEDDRSEIYTWLTKIVCYEERLIENVHILKHKFRKEDLDRLLIDLWTRPDLCMIPERTRMNVHFIILGYCWTGARLGAFFEGDGLCYKDIHLDLKRYSDNSQKFVYKIDQRWVKNNRDPENVAYGIPIEEHGTMRYAEILLLLSMALADEALFGYKSWDHLWDQEIPDGDNHVKLLWEESSRTKPILRKVEFDGTVSEKMMSRSTFERIVRMMLLNAGYSTRGGMHQIRRTLGAEVGARYGSVIRSQMLIQSDHRIFGQSYMANCVSADGKAAFLGEKSSHVAVDHFQGLERFREPNLPRQLPMHEVLMLEEEESIIAAKRTLSQLSTSESDQEASQAARQELHNCRHRLKKMRLKEYQKNWRAQRDKEKITSRGKEPRDATQQSPTHILIQLLPERRRLAQLITMDAAMSCEQARQASLDLYSLCIRDYSVLYRPCEEPTADSLCPVCDSLMDNLPKRNRSSHIHSCRRRQEAERIGRMQNEILYCYFCFQWVQLGFRNWTEHCAQHLHSLGPLDCDRVTYGCSEIRPYRCAACVENIDERHVLQAYAPHHFWKHLERDHVNKIKSWPSACIYHGCPAAVSDRDSLWHHLVDRHYHSKRIAGQMFPTSSAGVKRLHSIDDETVPIQSLSSTADTSIADFKLEITQSSSQDPLGWDMPQSSLGPPISPLPTGGALLELIDPALGGHDFSAPTKHSTEDSLNEVFRSDIHVASPPAFDLEVEVPTTLKASSPSSIPETQSFSTADFPAQESQEEWPVEKLLAKWKSGKSVFYLVKWKDFGDEENSWVSNKDIGREAIDLFESTFQGNELGVAVLDKRLVRNKRQYYVCWKGRPREESSWEAAESISHNLAKSFEESFEGHDAGVTLIDKRKKADVQVQYLVKWTGRPAKENSWIDSTLISCRRKLEFDLTQEAVGITCHRTKRRK